jgi:DnaJ-class molecular chaperone
MHPNNRITKQPNMKKIVLLAAAITLTSIGIGYAMNVHQPREHCKCGVVYKCSSCDGTGWSKDGSQCRVCKGTGKFKPY